MSTILLCAATGVEAKAVRRGVSMRASDFAVLQTGMGPVRAAAQLTNYLKNHPRPSRIVSTGFAASATSKIEIGTWIVATEVQTEGASAIVLAPSFDPKSLLMRTVVVESVARIVHLNKSQERSAAIDMESYALAQIAQRENIPFEVVRLISDNPEHPILEAVGSFAGTFLEERWIEKIKSAGIGFKQLSSEPAQMIRFLSRGVRLPELLAEGWQNLSAGLKNSKL